MTFELRTDARRNLVDACHIATLPVPEAALAKLMVLLGRAPAGRKLSYVSNAFRRPLLGEMTVDAAG